MLKYIHNVKKSVLSCCARDIYPRTSRVYTTLGLVLKSLNPKTDHLLRRRGSDHSQMPVRSTLYRRYIVCYRAARRLQCRHVIVIVILKIVIPFVCFFFQKDFSILRELRDPNGEVTLGRKLGEGSFGAVYRGA